MTLPGSLSARMPFREGDTAKLLRELSRRMDGLTTVAHPPAPLGGQTVSSGRLSIDGGEFVVDPSGAAVLMRNDVDQNGHSMGTIEFISPLSGSLNRITLLDDAVKPALQVFVAGYGWTWGGDNIERGNAARLTFTPDGLEVRAPGVSSSAFLPITASAFTVSSAREVKTDIEPVPFDSLAVIKASPAYAWRYRDEHAPNDAGHIGPMADDLPAELTTADARGVANVDLLSLVGVLWDAVGALASRVDALEASKGST